jgi:transketolase
MARYTDIDQLAINTMRMLAVDAVQKANSGHPGTPLDAAPTAYVLWQRFLRYDPADPHWLNRDRFVLSSGHASMLLYSLIHLTGIRAANPSYEQLDRDAVTLEDIKTFRQADSRCPGHPEYGWTSGVETTTGPLGQGVATSVGMAIASQWLHATYNRPGYDLFDFNVYALCGDGDMMEGVASEAASLAGHLRLSNLCWIYDSNRVTIEGHTDIAFTEDVAARFLAYGWNVERVTDPNDFDSLARGYQAFLNDKDRPTLIIVHSHIGYGAPHRQDTASAHGEPLGADEVRLTKEFFGFDPNQSFVVPDGVRAHFHKNFGARGAALRAAWNMAFVRYRAQYPDLGDQIERLQKRDLPNGWDSALPAFAPSATGMSTRDASGKILNAVAARVPWLAGGAADLAPSTKTLLTFEFAGDYQAGGPLGDHHGRNFHFGVREHAMCAAVSGMTLCGLRAFASGFLIFTDYARGAIRLASLMELPVLHIWTHDSISLGEDGPTHQPIEQIVSLRAIPGMIVIRPADANEMTEAYRFILGLKDRPAALICSRQALPIIDRSKFAPASGLTRGGYNLADTPGSVPDVILIGSGSEVPLCLAARDRLAAENINARVVSMPSWELFDAQDPAYQQSVLPPAVMARVTVEEASPIGWDRYAGPCGVVLGMRSFGMSAPMKIVAEHFGFNAEHVAAAAKTAMRNAAGVSRLADDQSCS